MKLENQVCSLELAKKLKELGVSQESYFAWYEENGNVELACQNNIGFFRFRDGAIIPPSHGRREYYSAFTVAELGEMLKVYFDKNSDMDIHDPRGYLRRGYQRIQSLETEAENRAKMLIYLIENKLV